jgi:hypothetical protein
VNINESFPSNYLKASDLGTGQPIVTIERVEHEAVGRDREMKAVLYFEGKEKGVVLNKTNARKITELAGSDDTDDWPGTRVSLYATDVEFNGETVDAIRIKAPAKVQARKPEPPPEPPDVAADDIPF